MGVKTRLALGDPLASSLRRYYIDAFHEREVSALAPGSLVLDLGGNRTRKRGSFDIERHPVRVVYANLSRAKRPYVQADALALPYAPGTFDAIVCSEVLEHVPSPVATLLEIRRVVRTAGHLIVCAPFLHPIHGDPQDYGRYTAAFWRGRNAAPSWPTRPNRGRSCRALPPDLAS